MGFIEILDSDLLCKCTPIELNDTYVKTLMRSEINITYLQVIYQMIFVIFVILYFSIKS